MPTASAPTRNTRVPARFITPILDLDELLARPAPANTRFVEVSSEPGGRPTISGALLTGLETFVGQEGSRTGRQPLPPHENIVATLESAGIDPETHVIIAPGARSDLSIAARAWVTLRWAGLADVAVIAPHQAESVAARAEELATWAAASEGREQGRAARRFSVDPSVIATEADVVALGTPTVLIDARRPSAYGDAGDHIPGALNLPTELLLAEDRFTDPGTLRAIFRERIDVDPAEQPLILSCGSGISASVQALALAHAGISCPVYIGSWSEWRKLHPRD